MKKHGFTLIELLVVISIIALLVAILMPALNKAKLLASAASCGSNVHQLSIAWVAYVIENDDRMPGANCGDKVPTSVLNSATLGYDWIQAPQDVDGDYVTSLTSTVDEQIHGIEAGVLYPYLMESEVYHCPGDRRDMRETTYRSYGISGAMNGGQDLSGGWLEHAKNDPYTKHTDVPSPADKYVFLEQRVNIANGYSSAWYITSEDNLTRSNVWHDPIMSWHDGATILGFADGHGEKHVWLQKSTVEMMDAPFPSCTSWPADDGVDDLRYMQRGFQ